MRNRETIDTADDQGGQARPIDREQEQEDEAERAERQTELERACAVLKRAMISFRCKDCTISPLIFPPSFPASGDAPSKMSNELAVAVGEYMGTEFRTILSAVPSPKTSNLAHILHLSQATQSMRRETLRNMFCNCFFKTGPSCSRNKSDCARVGHDSKHNNERRAIQGMNDARMRNNE